MIVIEISYEQETNQKHNLSGEGNGNKEQRFDSWPMVLQDVIVLGTW